MFVRLLVCGALSCALIATAAQSAAADVLKGKTGQGYRIKVVTKEQKLRLVSFRADLKCGDGSTLTLIESGFLWTSTKRNGAFRDAQFGKTDSVYFRGRVSDTRIRGQIRLTDKERRSPLCKSRWISFNATS